MCGICGVVWSEAGRMSPPGYAQAMADMIRHRGPDGEGFYERPGVSLAHRRLSIIDLEGGAQPLANEDETIWVTYNGEIYNFQSLHQELRDKGHTFRTRSDTEVLVHLYEEYGPRMLEKLRGMFAFAIWDAKKRELFVARDRLGVKPLVYRSDSEGFWFASELKSLLVVNGHDRKINPQALDEYLTYQYVPSPNTILSGYMKLPPGHYALIRDNKMSLHRYWRAPFAEEVKRSESDWIERLRETLTEATRLRMISDVPVGAFLSGGIDSTIVAGLMRKVSNGPVKTFSIGFPVKEFDETSYARLAARHLGTEHHELVVEPEATDVVHRLAWFYDEPFADSSAIPTYYVSKMTRQHVKVALSGDAGDEMFGGYPRYQAVQLGERVDRLPSVLRGLLTSPLWQHIPSSVKQKSILRRVKKLLMMLGRPARDRYREWIAIFGDAIRGEVYSNDFRQQLGGHRSARVLDSFYDELGSRDFVTQTMYVDVNTYLPGDILTKVDIASMANSLECRGPLLDQEVSVIAGGLPLSLKIHGRTTKYLLKRAFPELLPPPIQSRPKMGFGVPIDRWLRQELAPMLHDLLLSKRFRERGWFDSKMIEKLVNEHITGIWDHSYRLWALLMLERWSETFLDPTTIPRRPPEM